MKNPFEKENHTGLIAALVVGGIAAAALAYLFLTENGEEKLTVVKQKIKDTAKNVASGIVSDKTGISKKTVKKAADIAIK
jgi:gas vesicle protein